MMGEHAEKIIGIKRQFPIKIHCGTQDENGKPMRPFFDGLFMVQLVKKILQTTILMTFLGI
jgi:hypothetical protein